MREAARAQAAIEVLARIEADIVDGAPTAARHLADWGRASRYAGAKDRRAVSDLVHIALRRRGSTAAAAGIALKDAAEPPLERARLGVACALTDLGAAPEAVEREVFSGDRHAPPPFTTREQAQWRAAFESRDAPERRLDDFPVAHRDDLARATLDPAAEAAALRERGAADLRVNRLKTDRPHALSRLSEEGAAAAAGPLSPLAIRMSAPKPLGNLLSYRSGWIEPQDAASQATALLSGAAPGDLVIDFCAGGGGKSLALAAMMSGEGRLCAYDVAPKRMADLPERADRAGARVEIIDRAALTDLQARADIVFVDAPCSGAGAWSRNPDAKWTTTTKRIAALHAAQSEALSAAAPLVRPGGRLIYVTCSVLFSENRAQIEYFLAAHPSFEPDDLAAGWAAADLAGAPPDGPSSGLGGALIAPSLHQTDGFYVAALQRSGST